MYLFDRYKRSDWINKVCTRDDILIVQQSLQLRIVQSNSRKNNRRREINTVASTIVRAVMRIIVRNGVYGQCNVHLRGFSGSPPVACCTALLAYVPFHLFPYIALHSMIYVIRFISLVIFILHFCLVSTISSHILFIN